MKKSWIRTLLIVVMAMLLVFTLVACNPDSDDSGNTPPPGPGPEPEPWGGNEAVRDYWNRLWTLTSNIGGTEVEGDDDLAIELGLQVALNMRNANSATIYQQVDLGLDIQAVVGGRQKPAETSADGAQGEQKPSTAENTSIKIKLYDPTDSAHTEIASIYLLATDLDSIYIDFGGKNIKLPHNLVTTVWNEVMENEGSLIDELPDALNNPLLNIGGKEQSINELVNTFTDAFGRDWTLNTLVNGVVQMFGLKDTLNKFLADNSLIASVLGVSSLFDANGQIDILTILTGAVTTNAFTATTSDPVNGVVNHKVALTDSILSVVMGVVDTNIDKNAKYNLLSNLLGSSAANREIAFSFNEKDNEILDFTISAKLGGLMTDIDSVTVVPEIAITIDSLKIEKANQNNKVQISPASYKTNIALDEQIAFELSGLTLKNYKDILNGSNAGNDNQGVTAADEEPADLVLNHRVEIGVVGQLDLVGGRTVLPDDPAPTDPGEDQGNSSAEETEPEEPEVPDTNQTKLYAYVRLVDLSKDTDNVSNLIEASYVNSKLGIKIDSSIAAVVVDTLNNMGFVPEDVDLTGVDSLYYDVNINIADMFHDFAVGIASNVIAQWEYNHPADPEPDADPNVKTVAFKYGRQYVGEFIKITKGTALTVEQIPTVTPDPGYTFKGWYVGDTKIEAGYVVNEDIIAVAKFDEIPPETPETPAEKKDYTPLIAKMIKTFKASLKYVSTNNDIVVATDDILPAVVEIANIWREQDGANATDKWTVANREAAILASLNNPPLNPEDYTVGELLGEIIVLLTTPSEEPDVPGEIVGTTEEDPAPTPETPEEPTLMDYVLTALYKVAQHVEIAGVTPEEEQSVYDANILAVLHGALEVKLDAKNGFHISVKYSVADAHVGVTEKFEVVETDDDAETDIFTFPDIYAEYEAAVEAGEDVSNWLDIKELLPKKKVVNVAGNTFAYDHFSDDNGNLTGEQSAQIDALYGAYKFEFDTEGNVIFMTDAEGTNNVSATYEQAEETVTIIIVDSDDIILIVNGEYLEWYVSENDYAVTLCFSLVVPEAPVEPVE